MHDFDLILTLTGGFIAALSFGYLTERVGLSPIVGYLFAGILLGPHTPGYVANASIAGELAEVGVILLMFGVGLQFHFRELLDVRLIAVPGALVQSLLATGITTVIMHALGWTWTAGIVFGFAISVASTVLLTRVLTDNGDLRSLTGRIAIGWLVMEDLLTVLILVLLPAIFGSTATDSGVLAAVGWATLKIAALVVVTFFIGGWAIPRLLGKIAKTGSRELFTLAILAVALGISVGSAICFGVSMALGAFLAGMIVGRSEFSVRAATEAVPMRDAFAVLFFVSMGMLFDWRNVVQSGKLVLAAMVVILVAKPLAAFAIALVMRYPIRVALAVAIVLAQIGEFSFILASMGRQLKVLPASAENILVAAAIMSISLNPLAYRFRGNLEKILVWVAPRLVTLLDRRARCELSGDAKNESAAGKQAAVVAG